MSATISGATGTAFINSDWITGSATSTYDSYTATGACVRTMFDRRIDDYASYNTWCFDVQFSDQDKIVEF